MISKNKKCDLITYDVKGANGMTKKDYIDLIMVAEDIEKLDKTLQYLTDYTHSQSNFANLDKIYNVIKNNSNVYYHQENDLVEELFFRIIEDTDKSFEERADILLNARITCDTEENNS